MARSAGFQVNNIIVSGQDLDSKLQVLEALANLATANVEGKQTIAILTATNAFLVKELFKLQKEFAAFQQTSRNVSKHYYLNYRMHYNHNSKICKVKKPGYKDKAT